MPITGIQPEKPLAMLICEQKPTSFVWRSSVLPVRHRGNAVILPRTKQLAVFNLHNGLDIYNFPELHGKRQTVFDVDPRTTQGIAVLKSGSLVACPTRGGPINLIDCNSAVTGSLRCKIFPSNHITSDPFSR